MNTTEPSILEYLFASEPNHPYWKTLMDTLFTIDRTKLDYNTDKNIDGNVLGTGPMFVFAMWKKYSKLNDDICVSKRSLFHPPTKNNKEYIEELKKMGVTEYTFVRDYGEIINYKISCYIANATT